MLKTTILSLFATILVVSNLWAQSSLQGVVQDADTRKGIEGALVRVEKTKVSDETAEDGSFSLKGLPKRGEFTLVAIMDGYEPFEQSVKLGKTAKAQTIFLKKIVAENVIGNDDLPTVTLEQAESETRGNSEVASALGASRDIFQSAAGFNLFSFRFQPRGYDGENNLLFLNYIPMNDPETGFGSFSEFGGLNDVTRARDNSVSLEPTEYTFGSIGGSSLIDCRASRQRKQIRVGYSNSNRQYDHRLMATYSTGLMSNGWAVAASVSRRWASEGYVEGTFFDGHSYFLSVDKKLSSKSMIDFTVFAAQSERGRSGGSFLEMYELTGDKYYNPLWGFQNGEKRNASVQKQHQPTAILRFDHDFSVHTKWITAASYQTGKRSTTSLDWYNAPDPRPDYYKNLPSYISNDPIRQEEQRRFLAEKPENRQIHWDDFYYGNRANVVSLNDNLGNVVATGAQSQVALLDRRTDSDEANFNTILNHTLNDRVTLQGGALYQNYVGHNFQTIADLLGGDFYINWDKYADRDNPGDETTRQFDVKNPNRAAKVGDRFGTDYDENIRTGSAWAQTQVVLPKVDFFVAGNVGQTTLFRDGKVQNGKFPDNSFGKGDVHKFLTYGTKGGLTYKISGKHYLYANAAYLSRAPQFRNIYLAPRTRDGIVDNPDNEKVTSGEVGYLLRTPYWKGRLTGFYTTINDQTSLKSVYFPNRNTFGSQAQTGVNERHIGVEGGIEAKVTTSMTILLGGSLGENIYTSDPKLYVAADNTGDLVIDGAEVYLKNYHVRGPQSAISLTIKYDLKKHAYINLSGNYADKIWFDVDPTRRTADYLTFFDSNPVIRDLAIKQSSAPAAWTLDFFGGKSWKIKRDFLYLNLGISNITNNKFINSGWENPPAGFRIDAIDTVDPAQLSALGLRNKGIYNFGTTYFVSVTWRR